MDSAVGTAVVAPSTSSVGASSSGAGTKEPFVHALSAAKESESEVAADADVPNAARRRASIAAPQSDVVSTQTAASVTLVSVAASGAARAALSTAAHDGSTAACRRRARRRAVLTGALGATAIDVRLPSAKTVETSWMTTDAAGTPAAAATSPRSSSASRFRPPSSSAAGTPGSDSVRSACAREGGARRGSA